jgi:glutamate 5-kinase
VVARGLVNYDVAEIPALMGRSTRSLAAELGPEYEREVVHRDDLVILAPPGRRPAQPARRLQGPSGGPAVTKVPQR